MTNANTFQSIETKLAEIAHAHGVQVEATPDRVVFRATYNRKIPNWNAARDAVVNARRDLACYVIDAWGDENGEGMGCRIMRDGKRKVWGTYLGRDLDGAVAGMEIMARADADLELRVRGLQRVQRWRMLGRPRPGGRLHVIVETAARPVVTYTIPPVV